MPSSIRITPTTTKVEIIKSLESAPTIYRHKYNYYCCYDVKPYICCHLDFFGGLMPESILISFISICDKFSLL
jgi:hypothetical protein